MWKVNFYKKLPPIALAPFHDASSPKRALVQHYLTSPSLLGPMKSSGGICSSSGIMRVTLYSTFLGPRTPYNIYPKINVAIVLKVVILLDLVEIEY